MAVVGSQGAPPAPRDAASDAPKASGAPAASAAFVSLPLVATLFLASGATGLLYEVAFSKFLSTVFGATAWAVSTVLAAFMGGLALGAHVAGRWGARTRRPLVAYGALEICVGLTAAATPALFEAITSAYVSLARSAPSSLAMLTIVRGALTALVVVVPTVAMGATLPLLSRVVAGRADPASGKRLALLYAINTAGGAAGALASAYAVLPSLGIRGTMYAAAVVDLAIGAVAIVHGKGLVAGDASARASTEETGRDRADPILLPLAAASGFLVFAAEVVETHLLTLLIGNSAYAFGLMLATFLVCLAVGAARTPAFARRHGAAALPMGLALAALFAGLALPLWDQLPRLFAAAGKVVHGWAGREIVRAAAALAILAPPTIWMGSTFPLLLERVATRADVHRRVGRLTAINTLGTIAGSIVTGYVVLPTLGSQGTLRAVAVCFALSAAAVVLFARVEDGSGTPSRSAGSPRRALLLAGLAAAVALLVPRWDLARLTSGANVYFAMGPPPDQIVFVREDVHGGVTTVARRAGITTMYTNGKFQGDDGPEMPAQRRFAHFPSLFVRQERHALVIGLGTGTTLGTVLTYPYERVDVAEISPAIVDAARAFFSGPSRDALSDPRVRLLLDDGRNVLLVTNERYDLVTIELTSVWFAGASSLYSREFYDLVRARLAPGGVLQQWLQLHHIRRRELAAIVHTLRTSFSHVALFVGGSQGILVASETPLVASAERLARLSQRPDIVATLGGKALPDLLDELYSSGAELDRFVAETPDVPLSTDDNLYLEYATPKGNVLEYERSLRDTLALLDRYRTPDARARHLGP